MRFPEIFAAVLDLLSTAEKVVTFVIKFVVIVNVVFN